MPIQFTYANLQFAVVEVKNYYKFFFFVSRRLGEFSFFLLENKYHVKGYYIYIAINVRLFFMWVFFFGGNNGTRLSSFFLLKKKRNKIA